jgi:PAS domain-containing protein
MVVIRIGRKRNMQASKIESLRALAFLPFGDQREIDHHDGVFLHDADEQNDPDDGNHVQVDLEQHQRQHGADTGRRHRRDDGQRMYQTLIEHAEHDVDRQQGRATSIGSVLSDCW